MCSGIIKFYVDHRKNTSITNILIFVEESSKCCETECDYGTCGILRAQYHLGPAVSFLPILINYYDTLIKTEHGEELVESIYSQIATILITKIKVSAEECNLYAEKNYQHKNYFQAILFHLIAGQLLPSTKDVSRQLHGVQAFMLGIKLCIMKIAQEYSFYNNIVRLRILPKMRIFLKAVFERIIGRSKKDLVMVEVLCMHHLEVSEGFVGDYDASEATLIASLDRLEAVLGEGAKTVHLYGTALNNLGATYLRKKKPDEAIDRLTQAIVVNMNATDYTSEEERTNDVQRSERVLNQAENMKKRMAGN